MADTYLITGYWGEPHVTSENDRGINAATFGTGRFVLPVGEQFKAEYIGNNTVRMYDGKLMDNGAAAGIPAGEFIDLLISNAGQGMKRNDLIVFQYAQDASTLIESGRFVVIQGEETSGTAVDPALTQQDLLSGTATFDQMAMWRISVSGATIAAPEQVFTVGEVSGGIKMELLWENASPSSQFPAQTLAMDLSEYDFLYVECLTHYNSGSFHWYRKSSIVKVPPKGTTFFHQVDGFGQEAAHFTLRAFNVTTEGVNFGASYYANSYGGNVATSNNNYIPLSVYGIKGVITA